MISYIIANFLNIRWQRRRRYWVKL